MYKYSQISNKYTYLCDLLFTDEVKNRTTPLAYSANNVQKDSNLQNIQLFDYTQIRSVLPVSR